MLIDRFGRPIVAQEQTPTYRSDRWQNDLTGIGTPGDKSTHGRFFPVSRVLDQELTSLYNGSDIAAKAVEARPFEMFRRGFEIEADGVDASAIADVREFATEHLELEETIRNGMKWGNLWGGCLAIMNIDDGQDPWEPLDETRIRSFGSMNLIDRRFAYVQAQYSNINSPKHGKPMLYLISNAVASTGWSSYGKVKQKSPDELRAQGAQIAVIHESRVIRFDGNDADIVTRQALAGWTWSVLQRVYDAMRQFEHAFDSVGYLLSDASQGVFKLQGLLKAISSGQRQALADRIMLMEQTRSVMRGIALDAGGTDGKNGEDFTRVPTPFGGIPDLLDKMMLRLASALDMPATKLFGRAPAGLNATGDADIRNWYDQLATEQTTAATPRLQRVLRLLALAKQGPLGGKYVKWKIHHKPLWNPTDSELATARLTNAQRDQIYLTEGVVKPEEVAVDLADVYPHLDVVARETAIDDGKTFDPYENDPEPEPPPPPPGGQVGQGSPVTGEPLSSAAPVPLIGPGTANKPIPGGKQKPAPKLGKPKPKGAG